MEKKILIDTDGVLRDFVEGCQERYCKTLDFTETKSIIKILEISQETFVKDLDDCRFWMELKLTKEAYQIIKILERYFKADNIYLISSSYQTPKIVAGCVWWYKKYFPYFYEHKKIILCNEKHLFANINTILLDDHGEVCKAFSAHGGWSILMPRPWNNAHKTLFPVDRVEDELRMILNITEGVANG